MKKDIEKLLNHLRQFTDTFSNSQIYLNGEDEDWKMMVEIKKIAKKYKLKF